MKASVPCEYRGFSERVEITRQELEEASQDLLDRTRFTMSQTLKAAGLDWDRLRSHSLDRRIDADADGPRDGQASFR